MNTPDVSSRVTDLEILVTHLQRDIEDLHQVVLEQQKELEQLRSVISQVDHRVGVLEVDEEPRDAAAERPPHY